MTAHHRRGPWSDAEDNYLTELVKHHGPSNWVLISTTLGSRTAKQCRERYHQNLKPSLKHDPISAEEGIEIERMVETMGKRWAEIARRLNGRSDNAVKNWWNGSQNRRKRHDKRRAGHGHHDGHGRLPHSQPHVAGHDSFLERPRHQPSHFGRALPPLPPLQIRPTYALSQRAAQSPLSPPYHRQAAYFDNAELPSPSSTGSPMADDGGSPPASYSSEASSYTTSPGVRSDNLYAMASFRNVVLAEPRTTFPSGDYLPAIDDAVRSLPFTSGDDARKLPPIRVLGDSLSPGSHLPTAPNSPATPSQRPIGRGDRTPTAGTPGPPSDHKDSRMDLSTLLR